MNEHIKKLFEQRARNFEALKALDSAVMARDGVYTAEEKEQNARMDAEHVRLTEDIARLERQMKIEAELKADTREAIFAIKGDNKDVKADAGRIADDYRAVFLKMIKGDSPLTNAERSVVESYRAVMNVTTPSQGGDLVPVYYQAKVLEKMRDVNVMRRIAKVIRTNSTTIIPVGATKPTFSWIAESGTYGKTDMTFERATLGAHKSGGIVQLTDELLRDSMIDIEEYITNEMVAGMADAEELAFISGDGVGKPTGVMVGAELGVTTAVGNAVTLDEVLDLKYSLKAGYRGKAVFLYNSKTELALRKLKDSNGQFLWQPSVVAGTPNTLDGTPAVISDRIDDIGAGKKFMAIGDFSNYVIADRGVMTIKRLDEIYAEQGQIGFRVDASVDGKLLLSEAVKYMVGHE